MMKNKSRILIFVLTLLITLFIGCNKIFALPKYYIGQYVYREVTSKDSGYHYYSDLIKDKSGNLYTGKILDHNGTPKGGTRHELYCLDAALSAPEDLYIRRVLDAHNAQDAALLYIMRSPELNYYEKTIAVRSLNQFMYRYRKRADGKEFTYAATNSGKNWLSSSENQAATRAIIADPNDLGGYLDRLGFSSTYYDGSYVLNENNSMVSNAKRVVGYALKFATEVRRRYDSNCGDDGSCTFVDRRTISLVNNIKGGTDGYKQNLKITDHSSDYKTLYINDDIYFVIKFEHFNNKINKDEVVNLWFDNIESLKSGSTYQYRVVTAKELDLNTIAGYSKGWKELKTTTNLIDDLQGSTTTYLAFKFSLKGSIENGSNVSLGILVQPVSYEYDLSQITGAYATPSYNAQRFLFADGDLNHGLVRVDQNRVNLTASISPVVCKDQTFKSESECNSYISKNKNADKSFEKAVCDGKKLTCSPKVTCSYYEDTTKNKTVTCDTVLYKSSKDGKDVTVRRLINTIKVGTEDQKRGAIEQLVKRLNLKSDQEAKDMKCDYAGKIVCSERYTCSNYEKGTGAKILNKKVTCDTVLYKNKDGKDITVRALISTDTASAHEILAKYLKLSTTEEAELMSCKKDGNIKCSNTCKEDYEGKEAWSILQDYILSKAYATIEKELNLVPGEGKKFSYRSEGLKSIIVCSPNTCKDYENKACSSYKNLTSLLQDKSANRVQIMRLLNYADQHELDITKCVNNKIVCDDGNLPSKCSDFEGKKYKTKYNVGTCEKALYELKRAGAKDADWATCLTDDAESVLTCNETCDSLQSKVGSNKEYQKETGLYKFIDVLKKYDTLPDPDRNPLESLKARLVTDGSKADNNTKVVCYSCNDFNGKTIKNIVINGKKVNDLKTLKGYISDPNAAIEYDGKLYCSNNVKCEDYEGNKYADIYDINKCDDAVTDLNKRGDNRGKCINNTLVCNATCESHLSKVQPSSSFKGKTGLDKYKDILGYYDEIYTRTGANAEKPKAKLNDKTNDKHIVCYSCSNFEGSVLDGTLKIAGKKIDTLAKLQYQISDPDAAYIKDGKVACRPNTCQAMEGNKYKDYGYTTCKSASEYINKADAKNNNQAQCINEKLFCNGTCDSLLPEVQKTKEFSGKNADAGLAVFKVILATYDNIAGRKEPNLEADKAALNKSEQNEKHIVCHTCEEFDGNALGSFSIAGEQINDIASFRYQISNPSDAFEINGAVSCRKNVCKSTPNKNNTEEYKNWIRQCCHVETMQSEDDYNVQNECYNKGNKEACQVYENYCSVCDTKFNINNTCVDFNPDVESTDVKADQLVVDEKDNKGHIVGPENVKLCVVDDSEYASKKTSSYLLNRAEDKNVAPYDGTNGNPYCSVFCKEDVDFDIPKGAYVINGQYFTLGMNIDSTKTCYTGIISYSAFKSDLERYKADYANATTDAAKKAALSNMNKSVNYIKACGAGWNATYEYDPKISFTYDDKEYIDMLNGSDFNFVKYKDNEYEDNGKAWICLGEYSDVNNEYNKCQNGTLLEYNISEINNLKEKFGANFSKYFEEITYPTESGNTTVYIPKNMTYAKLTVKKGGYYAPDDIFFTKASTGVVKYAGECQGNKECYYIDEKTKNKILPKDNYLNYSLITDTAFATLKGLKYTGTIPVKLSDDRGVYNYQFTFDNIGEFFNKGIISQNYKLGRLIATDVNKKPLVNAINNEFKGKYVCAYVVNCPECEIKCKPDPKRGIYCEVPECDGTNCPLEGDSIGTAYSPKYGLLYTEEQVSLINMTNKNRETGFNWNVDKNPKAAATVQAIESKGESIYEEPEYSFEFTPATISYLRNLNKDAEKESSLYTSDSMLECKDKVVKDAQGNEFRYQSCTTKLFDEIKANGGKVTVHPNARSEVKSWLESDYCKDPSNENKCAIMGALPLGPAWK